MAKKTAKPAFILTAQPFRWLADRGEYVLSGKGAMRRVVGLGSFRRCVAPFRTRRYAIIRLEPDVPFPGPGRQKGQAALAHEAHIAGARAFLRAWDMIADEYGDWQCVRRRDGTGRTGLCPFPADQLPGGVLEVRPHWTVPRDEALGALEFFVQQWKCDPALPWVDVEDFTWLEEADPGPAADRPRG